MRRSFFRHPLTILAGAAAGVLIGMYYLPISAFFKIDSSRFLHSVSFPGKLYLLFLQMIVIPVIISAAASGIGKLIRGKTCAALIKRMIAVLILFMVICALTGMALGAAGRPGLSLDAENKLLLGKYISASGLDDSAGALEINLNESPRSKQSGQSGNINSIYTNFTAPDIFKVMSFGVLAVLFFSFALGAAIGFLHEESALILINFFTAVSNAFQKIVSGALYLLPFGLICILAGYSASLNLQIFAVMRKFIILFGSGAAGIFILCAIIICIKSSVYNPLKAVTLLAEPIMISLAAQNSMTALPAAMNCLEKDMKFSASEINITLPAGMVLGRFGDIFYFSLGVFFTAQIYGTILQPAHFLIIFAGVIFAGAAASGTAGILTLPLFGIILEPLNLPLEAALFIFIIIDPVISPVRAFLTLYVNIAAASIIAKKNDNYGQDMLGEKELIVFIQRTQNNPPLLKRVNGIPKGLEISFLHEIGRRCGRQVIIKDCRSMNSYEREWMKEKAGIIAGVISKASVHELPAGFYFSKTWASVNVNGVKTQLHFLLPEKNANAKEIDDMIQILSEENYFKLISSDAKKRGY